MIEPATRADAPPVPGPSRRLYRLTLVALAATVLVVSLTIPALRWHHTNEALARLAAAEAEADRLDPGWRLEELEARREKVPDEENAALVVIKAAGGIPDSWPPRRFRPNGEEWYLEVEIGANAFGHLIPGDLLDLLRSDLRAAGAALDAAPPLRTLHTGQYPGAGGKQDVDYLQRARRDADYFQRARSVASLVVQDALLRANTGDMAGAVACCRQAMAVARSFGDEPAAVPALVRIAISSLAIAQLERVLALGECSDPDLRDLQELIQREEKLPMLLLAMRGDRAHMHHLLSSEPGPPYHPHPTPRGGPGPMPTGADEEEETRLRWTLRLFLSDKAYLAGNGARLLEALTRAVEVAKLPVQEQARLFVELEKEQNRDDDGAIEKLLSVLARGIAHQKIASAFHRSTARLRCADAALAIERYRLRHGDWPNRLDELLPEFLPDVPLDPFTGQRLAFRRTEYGVVVYSFGPDGRDDGGDVGEEFVTGRRMLDIGFRLYDPRRRGMLALPDGAVPALAPASGK